MVLLRGMLRTLAVMLVLTANSGALAGPDDVWVVSKSSGEVWVTTTGAAPASLTKEDALNPGDTIRTGRNGRVLPPAIQALSPGHLVHRHPLRSQPAAPQPVARARLLMTTVTAMIRARGTARAKARARPAAGNRRVHQNLLARPSLLVLLGDPAAPPANIDW
jgi:hypothetical protein